jgi:hypothetical protein
MSPRRLVSGGLVRIGSYPNKARVRFDRRKGQLPANDAGFDKAKKRSSRVSGETEEWE